MAAAVMSQFWLPPSTATVSAKDKAIWSNPKVLEMYVFTIIGSPGAFGFKCTVPVVQDLGV